MLNKLFKSIIDADTQPVVVCDMNSIVVYMNPASIKMYHCDITGKSIKGCHNADSNEKIDKVIDWFSKSVENNIVFTSFDEKKNKDVYMVALRGDDGALIGYYEKHESREKETAKFYDI